jgi:signal transduction histidine kinase
MTPDVLAHLGEPFFTTKERGSGLGLGISRRIVEEHGGKLEVRSRAGEGTEVEVTLPPLE